MFFVLHIPHTHKIKIRNKQSYQDKQGYGIGDKQTLVDKEVRRPSRLLKRTMSCFGNAKPFNLLTSYRDFHSVRYTKPVRQLVTGIGQCSRVGLAV